MDQEFASSPSESTWEPPRVLHTFIRSYPDEITTRGQVFRRAQEELWELCKATGSCSALEDFLKRWRDPKHPDRIQPNALAWFEEEDFIACALSNGRQDAVRIMQAHGVKPGEVAVLAALTILEETASKQELELILEGGWGIDEPVSHSSPPLLGYMISINNEDMVDWCLARGASPNAASPIGGNAMQKAAAQGSIDTLKTLRSHGGTIEGTDLVAHAAFTYRSGEEDRLEIIQYLLDNGAPIDAYYMGNSEEWNSTSNPRFLWQGEQNALHFAISNNNKDLLELLISRGADRGLEMLSLQTEYKKLKPRELASLLGHEDLVALL
ncbi:hypothetical protein E8E13_002651 [Curvularia kusanoi]|uniref:Uncharacterized protein n=1 Tax=Curvularia kusanoi TaxID=90978 RepID=A0A9P4TBD5_CURKU|nr:hypothetical protein E8E13_002651 [Curvularia kusanoi]